MGKSRADFPPCFRGGIADYSPRHKSGLKSWRDEVPRVLIRDSRPSASTELGPPPWKRWVKSVVPVIICHLRSSVYICGSNCVSSVQESGDGVRHLRTGPKSPSFGSARCNRRGGRHRESRRGRRPARNRETAASADLKPLPNRSSVAPSGGSPVTCEPFAIPSTSPWTGRLERGTPMRGSRDSRPAAQMRVGPGCASRPGVSRPLRRAGSIAAAGARTTGSRCGGTSPGRSDVTSNPARHGGRCLHGD
jgi:hypothetical protein